jgi:hypothetical protein
VLVWFRFTSFDFFFVFSLSVLEWYKFKQTLVVISKKRNLCKVIFLLGIARIYCYKTKFTITSDYPAIPQKSQFQTLQLHYNLLKLWNGGHGNLVNVQDESKIDKRNLTECLSFATICLSKFVFLNSKDTFKKFC